MYLGRYCVDGGGLGGSVGARGVVVPVVVEEWGGGYRVISGFRRVAAAVAGGIGEVRAVVYSRGALSGREAFGLSLASNAPGGTLNDADRAAALWKASRDFGFSEDELIEEVAGLVGLPASHRVVRQYLDIARLPEGVLDALGGGEISREHALAVCRVAQDERAWFFEEVVQGFRLSAGDARIVAGAGIDLAGREGRGFREVVGEVVAGARAGAAGEGRRALKEALMRRVSPVICEMEDEFEALAAGLEAGDSVRVEHSGNFEADEVRITLVARKTGEIEAFRAMLERGLGEGIFEKMLSLARRKGEEILGEMRKEGGN